MKAEGQSKKLIRIVSHGPEMFAMKHCTGSSGRCQPSADDNIRYAKLGLKETFHKNTRVGTQLVATPKNGLADDAWPSGPN